MLTLRFPVSGQNYAMRPPSGHAFQRSQAPQPNFRMQADTFGHVGRASHIMDKPRFGFAGCGVCPMCVAGAAAARTVNQIRDLQGDKGNDLTIEAGKTANRLRKSAQSITGNGNVDIQHFDGSRLQPMPPEEFPILELAALPRVYAGTDKTKYTLKADLDERWKDISRGIGNSLTRVEKHISYHKSDTPGLNVPQILGESSDALRNHMQTFGLVHHLNEKTSGAETLPVVIGYTTLTEKRDRELLVASTRELPQMEGFGIDAAGVMNALGLAAKSGRYDSVAVMVEPFQSDVEKYLKKLKTHTAVKEFQDDIPDEYADLRAKYHTGLSVYQVDLEPLKKLYADTPGETVEDKDVAFLKQIEVSDMEEAEHAEPDACKTDRSPLMNWREVVFRKP